MMNNLRIRMDGKKGKKGGCERDRGRKREKNEDRAGARLRCS